MHIHVLKNNFNAKCCKLMINVKIICESIQFNEEISLLLSLVVGLHFIIFAPGRDGNFE
jgi:hypothetical protein